MADLPVQPLENFGNLLGIAPTNAAQQSEAQTAALNGVQNRQYVAAQTQAQQFQNQLMRQRINWMLQMQQPGANASGAAVTSAPASAPDQSSVPGPGNGGVNAAGVPNDLAAPDSSGSAGSAPTGDGTSLEDWGLDGQHVSDHVQQKFAPPVPYLPQELSQLNYARQGMALGVPGADAIAQTVETQRQARIQNQVQSNQQQALKTYNEADAVLHAYDSKGNQTDNPHPWDTLDRINPTAADAINKAAEAKGEQQGWDQDQIDAQRDNLTRAYATEVGGATYRYTGDEAVVGADGVARDKNTNRPVIGGVATGLSARDQADLQQRRLQMQQEALTAQRGQNIAGAQGTGALPPTAIVGAPGVGQTPAAPSAGTSASSASGGNQPPPASQATGNNDNGLLPGVDVAQLPKPNTSSVNLTKANQEAYTSAMKDSSTAYTDAQKESALIRAAQGEVSKLASAPRMTGPGSELDQGLAKIKAFATGQPPDALVDLGVLDKTLLQMGAQNIRQALSGQRITNQEFMALLSKGNPNTEQPLATVNRLLGFLGAQNDYDQRLQRTKQQALRAGADPLTVDSDISAKVDRGDYVLSRTGVRPGSPGAPGATAGTPIASKAQYDALPRGAPYTFNGRAGIKQ